MKVLIVSHFYKTTPPIGTGSIELFTDYLANYLVRIKNTDVLVVCKTGSTGGDYKISTCEELNYVDVVKSEIQNFKPDLIHVMFDDLLLFDFLKVQKIPVVYTIMSYARPSNWPKLFFESPENFLFVAVSTNFKKYLLKEFRYFFPTKFINVKKIVSIGLTVDVDFFSSHASNLKKGYYVYLGLIRKHKAVLEIVNFFSKTNKRLYVAGPVKDIPYCHEVLDVINNSKNIKYCGEITDDISKIKLLSESLGMVIATGYSPLEPDCHEAGGTVLIEANACGTPVIGYSQGVMESYIKPGKNGYLFKDIEELNSFFPYLESKDMFKDCTAAAKPYHINSIGLKYFKTYQKFIEKLN